MLQIDVPGRELFDERKQEFVAVKPVTLQLEHSLVSLSKWESKWCKPFLSNDQRSDEEVIDYIRCMTISQNVDPDVFLNLPQSAYRDIEAYINAKMTATWFSDNQDHRSNNEIITAEIIYYWMIAQNIPMECQKWHLNRLLTLVRVCSIKNAPQKKTGRKESLSSRAALNRARKAQLNSKG